MEWTLENGVHAARGMLGTYRIHAEACAMSGPTGRLTMHMQLLGDTSGLRVIRFGSGTTLRAMKAKAEKHNATVKPLKWEKTFDHREASAEKGLYHIDPCDPGLGRPRFMLRHLPADSATGSWDRLGSASDVKWLQRVAQHHAIK